MRNLIAEHSLPRLGLELSDDSQAAARWQLKSGGSLFAIGASGALAGYRADLVILDDIYRSMEDAYSENIRQKISDWFYGEVLPRCRPGARVVGIGTRFHHADLFAELEASGRYKVIRLLAVAEEDDELGRPVGTYLWDDQAGTYPYADFLRQQREVQPPRVWASLFMNRPSPVEGAFFKASWLKTFHNQPPRENLKTYIAVDFAVTESATADFTAIMVFGLDPAGRERAAKERARAVSERAHEPAQDLRRRRDDTEPSRQGNSRAIDSGADGGARAFSAGTLAGGVAQ